MKVFVVNLGEWERDRLSGAGYIGPSLPVAPTHRCLKVCMLRLMSQHYCAVYSLNCQLTLMENRSSIPCIPERHLLWAQTVLSVISGRNVH